MTKIQRSKGFTLIELMIVVAIIGILAAVAIPKFADLVTKSKEASVKGSLGAVRSAVSIYYGDMEGTYPGNLFTGLSAANRYMPAVGGTQSVGTVQIPKNSTGFTGHDFGASVDITEINDGGTAYADGCAFFYHTLDGAVEIGCGHKDTRGSVWSEY